jgi:D-alanyl-D-alanine carboxypeptidase/D-alanyl-D-alanine-endopeptidase (penicillin-binding protein 4)
MPSNTTTGEVVVDENSEKSLMPASCMKAITTAAALQILGPETRFQTDLEYDGIIDNSGRFMEISISMEEGILVSVLIGSKGRCMG